MFSRGTLSDAQRKTFETNAVRLRGEIKTASDDLAAHEKNARRAYNTRNTTLLNECRRQVELTRAKLKRHQDALAQIERTLDVGADMVNTGLVQDAQKAELRMLEADKRRDARSGGPHGGTAAQLRTARQERKAREALNGHLDAAAVEKDAAYDEALERSFGAPEGAGASATSDEAFLQSIGISTTTSAAAAAPAAATTTVGASAGANAMALPAVPRKAKPAPPPATAETEELSQHSHAPAPPTRVRVKRG